MLGIKLDDQLQQKIVSLRAQQASINCHVVLGVARALLLKHSKSSLSEFGGPIKLEKEWARQLLQRMGFSKRSQQLKSHQQNMKKLKDNIL